MAIRLVVLGSGSGGNATCIEGGGARILLDAGFSSRELSARLSAVGIEPHRLDAVLITHEHADHIRGAELFSGRHRVPIYCTSETFRAAGWDGERARAHVRVQADVPFEIGGMSITAFPVPHDAMHTVGFALECEGARVGYATDLGHCGGAVREGLRGCDLLVLEANHDVEMLRAGPYPEVVKQRVLGRFGHLDNETAADLAREVATDATRLVVLAHLSRTNNRPDLAVRAARLGFEAAGRRAPAIHPAGQSAPSPWFEV